MADLSCNLSCFLLWHHFENKAVSGSVPNSVPKLPNEVTCRKFHHLAEPLAEVLKTMREPDEQMAEVGDVAIWERMIRAALPAGELV